MTQDTKVNLEQVCLEIILASGNARGYLLEAFDYLKPRDEQKIKELLELANQEIVKAHQSQTALMSKEANGEEIKMSVLLIHAQDHLMTTITIRDLAEKIVEVL